MSCQHKNKIKTGIPMNVDQLTDQWFSTGQWFLRDRGTFMGISHCFCFFKLLEVSEARYVLFLWLIIEPFIPWHIALHLLLIQKFGVATPPGGCPQSAMILGASLCGPIVWSALTLAILDENHKLDGVDSAGELWLEIHLSKFDPTFVFHGYEQLEVEGFSTLDRWMKLGGFCSCFS